MHALEMAPALFTLRQGVLNSLDMGLGGTAHAGGHRSVRLTSWDANSMRRCSTHMSPQLYHQLSICSQVHYGKQSVLSLQAVAVDVRGLADSLKALVESGMHKAAGMLLSSNHAAVLPAFPDHSSRYKNTMPSIDREPCQQLMHVTLCRSNCQGSSCAQA